MSVAAAPFDRRRVFGRASLMRAFVRDVETYDKRRAAEKSIQPLWRHHLGATGLRVRRCVGDERIASIRYMLSLFDRTEEWRRSPPQRMLHDAMIEACLLRIYPKEEFMIHKTRILRDNNVPEKMPRQMVGFTCPRRFGKTIGTSMGAAVLAMAIPNFKLAIFSPGRRQSTMLLMALHNFICWLGGRDAIVRFNSEQLWLQGPSGPSDRREISSFPSKPETGKACVCVWSLSLSLSLAIGNPSRARCLVVLAARYYWTSKAGSTKVRDK